MFRRICGSNIFLYGHRLDAETAGRILDKFASCTEGIFWSDYREDLRYILCRTQRTHECAHVQGQSVTPQDGHNGTPSLTEYGTFYRGLSGCLDCSLLDSYRMSDKGECGAPVTALVRRISDKQTHPSLERVFFDVSSWDRDSLYIHPSMWDCFHQPHSRIFAAIVTGNLPSRSCADLRPWVFAQIIFRKCRTLFLHGNIEHGACRVANVSVAILICIFGCIRSSFVSSDARGARQVYRIQSKGQERVWFWLCRGIGSSSIFAALALDFWASRSVCNEYKPFRSEY